jgi:hypothetical protein
VFENEMQISNRRIMMKVGAFNPLVICCAVGGVSVWGFEFLLYGPKYVSVGHYFPST